MWRFPVLLASCVYGLHLDRGGVGMEIFRGKNWAWNFVVCLATTSEQPLFPVLNYEAFTESSKHSNNSFRFWLLATLYWFVISGDTMVILKHWKKQRNQRGRILIVVVWTTWHNHHVIWRHRPLSHTSKTFLLMSYIFPWSHLIHFAYNFDARRSSSDLMLMMRILNSPSPVIKDQKTWSA